MEWKHMLLADIPLKQRAIRVLAKAGIRTVRELLELSEDDLYRIQGLGKLTRGHIIDTLADQGLKLKAAQTLLPPWATADVASDPGSRPAGCQAPEQTSCRRCPHLVTCISEPPIVQS